MIEITIKAIYQRKRMQRPTATSAQIQISREKVLFAEMNG